MHHTFTAYDADGNPVKIKADNAEFLIISTVSPASLAPAPGAADEGDDTTTGSGSRRSRRAAAAEAEATAAAHLQIGDFVVYRVKLAELMQELFTTSAIR